MVALDWFIRRVDPVCFDQLAIDHNIENVEEWKNLLDSNQSAELQTRLNKLNRDLLTKWIQERQPDVTVREDEDVFDVLRRVVTSRYCLSDVLLYDLPDSLHASYYSFPLEFTDAPIYKVDCLSYLASWKRYELFSMLSERIDPMRNSYDLHIGKFLSDACLDNGDGSLNNLVDTLIRNWRVGRIAVDSVVSNPKFAVPDGYARNYIRLLRVSKETHNNSVWLNMCVQSIFAIFKRNQADKLQVLLSEITEQGLLSVEELAEFITSHDILISGVSLFERCLMSCETETCSVILGLLKKEDVTKFLMQENGTWLLTDMVVKERQDVIETVLEYGLDLTDDEKDTFHSQLVTGSLSQKMILLLKEQVGAYIIPEGKDKARKQALVYYNVKGREDLGDKEAQELIAGLKSLDFKVKPRPDWKVDTLEQDMKEDIQRVKDNCSVLVVFMMAHGSAKEICDADMKPVTHDYIDDIINSEENGIPEGIPKISIISACRKRRPQPGILKRFTQITSTMKQVKGSINPQDYCRIMSAAKDEVTYRNVMLPILMEEWKKGGEFTDIMYKVRGKIKEHDMPECRSTVTEEARTLGKRLWM